MSTKHLKILLAIIMCLILLIMGYGQGLAEDEKTTQQNKAIVSTGFNNEDIEEDSIIYSWQMVLDELVEKVNVLVGDKNISEAIVNECTTQVPDNYVACIRGVLGVANAESSLFKNGMKPSNNGFGLMYKGKKRKFSSVEESIQVWVSLYKKNGREKRITGADWLKGKAKYCASACTNRAKAYNQAVAKLELE